MVITLREALERARRSLSFRRLASDPFGQYRRVETRTRTEQQTYEVSPERQHRQQQSLIPPRARNRVQGAEKRRSSEAALGKYPF